MATAAEHMSAEISPFLALLTDLQHKVPAISRIGSQSDAWGEGATTYVGADGQAINPKTLSSDASQLLEDYRLVQYDLTAGKGYLYQTDFFDLP